MDGWWGSTYRDGVNASSYRGKTGSHSTTVRVRKYGLSGLRMTYRLMRVRLLLALGQDSGVSQAVFPR